MDQLTRPPAADYASLRQNLIAAGCFKYVPWRSVVSYVIHIAASVGLFAASASAPLWAAAPLFLCASLLFYRLGWLMHDAAHGGVFARPAPNRWFALLTAGTLGELPSGWRYGHNRHHAAPNVRGRDMDQAERWDPLRRYRGYLGALVGLLLLSRYRGVYLPKSLLLLGLRDGYFCHRHAHRNFFRELSVALAGLAAQIGFLCRLFGAPGIALFLVHTMIGMLYLNTVFSGNHYDLEAFDEDQADRLDFVELQVRATRNYPDGLLSRFLYGGMEHQIEHHLFPNLPRHQLRRAAPQVREFCQARGLPYARQSLPASLLGVLRFHISSG